MIPRETRKEGEIEGKKEEEKAGKGGERGVRELVWVRIFERRR